MGRDSRIAKLTKLKPIQKIADQIGLTKDDIELYGLYKAKIKHNVFERFADKKDG
ncbi:formate--tetrahydrofolate ligase, partial [candidate division WOR-3 bacterium]|nr:formate--tetrahydrofolate ligase [candidate division WOR-3 bacterium]